MRKDFFGIQVIVNANAINFCSIGEYLDYSNCKCRKKLVDPLVEECTKNIEETKVVKITPENENSYYKCSSC